MIETNVKLFFNKLDYLKNSSDRILIRSNLVKKFLGNLSQTQILDIGCGDGSLSLQYLEGDNSITFVDVSDKMLDRVKEQVSVEFLKNVTFVNAPFESIIFDKQFDVVLCVGVIAHVASVEELFKKIDKILKPGGVLVLETTPNPYPIGKLLFPYYCLRNLLLGSGARYSKNRLKVAELMKITSSINLTLLQSVRYSFPLPGMSHWPQSIKLKYTLFTLNNSLMSKLGSEHVFHFKRLN